MTKAFLILLSLSIVLIVSGLIAAFYTKTSIQLLASFTRQQAESNSR
jgi:hypothetical protein